MKSTFRDLLSREKGKIENLAGDVLKSIFVLAISTFISYFFSRRGFREANIITVYILGVLITAIWTSKRAYSLVSSVISVLLFNFLFTEPRYTFNAYDAGHLATFLVMFIAAFITSSLAVRIKQQAMQSAETAYRTKILFETNQQLGMEQDIQGIISVTCGQLRKLLKRDIIFYEVQNNKLGKPAVSPYQEEDLPNYLSPEETKVARWVLEHNIHAGAATKTFPEAECLYLSVRVGSDVFGVVGIAIGKSRPDSFEKSVMLSILGECALAMKNDKVSKERAAAALLAKNEQLRANLLRSISHDLRTPLTSISGNAGILLSSEESMDREKRRQLYEDIYDDSLWLINLVENLLSVTRIEDGTMKLRLNTELLEEIVHEAVKHVEKRSKEHSITVHFSDSLLLVKADARLIVQVLINLMDNAIKYTPAGSTIEVETRQKDGLAEVSVSDNGSGVSENAKAHIFEMFYTDATKAADSRRSLGLGLALCKSIITAHGGTIKVEDNQPHGARFVFTLPAKEVKLHE